MNKKILFLIAVIIIVLAGYFFYSSHSTPITHKNTAYGFDFSLPASWKGYSVVEGSWNGTPLKNGVAQTGPKLLIRNPKWTDTAPYEDLPVLIFTIPQWNAYIAEDFTVSAAPLLASELGRNNKYVFALPPRWDFDSSLNYKEAQDIIAGKPLHPFDIEVTSAPQGKLNINVVCESALAYMSFPDGASAQKFVDECKEGKHPEVIEKYKADMNLGDGAAI